MKQSKFEELIETFALPNLTDALETSNSSNQSNSILQSQNNNLNQIKTSILDTQAQIDAQTLSINNKSKMLDEKQKQIYGQSKEIDDKVKLLETRNRMLQLSIDRNIYKKKLIYSLLAVIIAMVVAMLFFYSYFNKNMMQTV